MTTNSNLPPLYTCAFCGTGVNPREPGVWRKVSGWVQNRKQGGANSISLPEAEFGYACNICIDIAKSKGRGGMAQDSLF